MTALVAAAGGVEFPRDVDADTSGVIVLTELCADVDSAIGRHLCILCMQNVVGKQGDTEAFVLEELATEAEIETAGSFPLGAS